VQNPFGNSKPFGHIDDGVPFIDNLLDRLGLELGGIFRAFHLHCSLSVLTSLFVY
jgi:hypothetical protein